MIGRINDWQCWCFYIAACYDHVLEYRVVKAWQRNGAQEWKNILFYNKSKRMETTGKDRLADCSQILYFQPNQVSWMSLTAQPRPPTLKDRMHQVQSPTTGQNRKATNPWPNKPDAKTQKYWNYCALTKPKGSPHELESPHPKLTYNQPYWRGILTY